VRECLKSESPTIPKKSAPTRRQDAYSPNDPQKESVRWQEAYSPNPQKREQRSPAGGVFSGASAVTAAGAVTVPGKALPVEAAFSGVGALSVDEAKVLHDIVRERVRLPEDMDWGEFRVGEDSTGEPAVWIVVGHR
jgi:hypothetical protein